MSTPLISVIVPVYNSEKYLSECLDSILNQTMGDIEVIGVNDGSCDRSSEILLHYADQDSRIRFLSQKNQGVAAARNRGIKEARGKYLYFVDSDDTIAPMLCEKAGLLAAKYDCDLVWVAVDDADEKIYHKKLYYDKPSHEEKSHYLFGSRQLPGRYLNRREHLQKRQIHFPDGMRVSEDMVFNYKSMIFAESLAVCPKRMYYYRQHSESVLHQKVDPENDRNFDLFLFHREMSFLFDEEPYRPYIRPTFKFAMIGELACYRRITQSEKKRWKQEFQKVLNKGTKAFIESGTLRQSQVYFFRQFYGYAFQKAAFRALEPFLLSWMKFKDIMRCILRQ